MTALDIAAADDALHPDETPFGLSQAEAKIAELAKLKPLDYEQRREVEAKALGMRVSILDKMVAEARPVMPADDADPFADIDPWDEPVDGAALADDIRARLNAHVVFGSPGDADLAALWVVGSYLMDTWRLWPKLMITSPTKQCGKSTLLEVLDALVFKGMIVSNTKSAGVFRAIEMWRPSLLLDEADTWMKDDVELGGILNCGHTRRTANVMRVVEKGGEHVPVLFSAWTAMAIAGIGGQQDTLMSRSIIISLRRKLSSETVQRLPFDLHERMLNTRRRIARWANDYSGMLGASEIEPPDCGNDRRRDNFTPLHRIAAVLGGAWPDRLAGAYVGHSAGDDDADEPAGVMLLRDLADIFAERHAERMQSSELVASLIDMEERPWAEWRHGRPLTTQSIAKLLRPFEVKPRNAKAMGNVFKSYYLSDVRAAFDRYVSQTPPKTPLPRYRLDNAKEKVADEVAGSGCDGNGSGYDGSGSGYGSGFQGQIDKQFQGGSGVAAGTPPPREDMPWEGEI